ncbi:MAG TPA: hypothetical protein VGL56_18745 [Fimbriimonadaceae bacterium]|jgi:hypothetical protein
MKKMIFAAMAAVLTTACFAQDTMDMKSRYGGPVYMGDPALNVTASLVQAGGGPENFSTVEALNHLLGKKLAKAEVAKLTDQYGADKVTSFVTVFNFVVADSLKIATAAGVKLPDADMKGKKLAATLVSAGTDKDGTFWIGTVLDKAVTHKIHMQVMDDIDAKYGQDADANYHRISNQAMYDAAQALGATSTKLASFH